MSNFERDDQGLIKGVDYIRLPDGRINWRRMVNPAYLTPLKKSDEGKDVTTLPDEELMILLQGIKELADLRGFTSKRLIPVSSTQDYSAMICEIVWIPNFETDRQPITYAEASDASVFNTTGVFKSYPATMAGNRAFVRCVRNFLKINVVGQDEVAAPKDEVAESSPHKALLKLLKSTGTKISAVKDYLKEQKFAGLDKISKVDDIPAWKVFELLEVFKAPESNIKV